LIPRGLDISRDLPIVERIHAHARACARSCMISEITACFRDLYTTRGAPERPWSSTT
jgi:hypothetical protein